LLPTVWLLTASAASMSSSVSFDGRPPVRPARPRSGKARLDAFPKQAALEFRRRAKHMKNSPTLRGRRVDGFGQAAKTDAFTRSLSMVLINCFIECAKRSSFHTTSVSPLRANSNASRKAGRSVSST
jgi:hypothetical protein